VTLSPGHPGAHGRAGTEGAIPAPADAAKSTRATGDLLRRLKELGTAVRNDYKEPPVMDEAETTLRARGPPPPRAPAQAPHKRSRPRAHAASSAPGPAAPSNQLLALCGVTGAAWAPARAHASSAPPRRGRAAAA